MKTTTLALAAAMAAGGAAHAQEAVQWRVEDGGNGHWYQIDADLMSWQDAASRAAQRGGHLGTITSVSEQAFITNSVYYTTEFADTWLGLSRLDCSAPFEWVSGEKYGSPPDGTAFNSDCGGWAGPGTGNYVEHVIRNGVVLGWETESNDANVGNISLVEWSADCNGDGIVDYGQILDGTFADTNANGVPDTCECLADVNQDGVVNGADISAVLGFWGQAGKPLPAADITRDGLVDGADLAVLLGSWGPCQ